MIKILTINKLDKLTLEEVDNLKSYDVIWVYDINKNNQECNEKLCVVKDCYSSTLIIGNVYSDTYSYIHKDKTNYNKTWTAYKYKPTYL